MPEELRGSRIWGCGVVGLGTGSRNWGLLGVGVGVWVEGLRFGELGN